MAEDTIESTYESTYEYMARWQHFAPSVAKHNQAKSLLAADADPNEAADKIRRGI
jgi:hypothetical protein